MRAVRRARVRQWWRGAGAGGRERPVEASSPWPLRGLSLPIKGGKSGSDLSAHGQSTQALMVPDKRYALSGMTPKSKGPGVAAGPSLSFRLSSAIEIRS